MLNYFGDIFWYARINLYYLLVVQAVRFYYQFITDYLLNCKDTNKSLNFCEVEYMSMISEMDSLGENRS